MTGRVFLVGSGPGDPELLTLKAQRVIAEADVVLHDKLLGPEILASIPEEKREDVGKRANDDSTTQEYTNQRLVDLAEDGHTVVRLKGGDPFVFGRGGEEAEFLAANGVPFEYVPGISSAIAGPGVAGIPLTHREYASSVTFVTGHEDPTKDDPPIDWEILAQTRGTLVVLMGVGTLGMYVEKLQTAGMPSETPAALVERATLPGQQVAVGTLDTIENDSTAVGIEPPAIAVIGEVAQTRDQVISFFQTSGERSQNQDDT